MNKPQELWNQFKLSFTQALDQNGRDQLLAAWREVSAKTYFYEWTLMPTIVKSLGYGLEIERLRCDYTFVDEHGVPLIVIESENAHETASREINCLCSLAAPLKILLLSCDWKASEKAKFLPRWQDIIRKHHAVVTLDCLYGIIVGEWDEPDDALLEYSFTLLNGQGSVVEESDHIVQPQSATHSSP